VTQPAPAALPPRTLAWLRRSRFAPGVPLGLAALIWLADSSLGSHVGLAGLYVAPLLMSAWGSTRRSPWPLFCLCAALALQVLPWETLGASEFEPAIWVNQAVVVFGLWITASLVQIRAATEADLEQSRQFTGTTLASIADAVLATDAQGRVRYLNRAAESLSGWQAADALGRPLADVLRLTSDSSAMLSGAAEGSRETRAGAPRLLLRRDGTQVPVDHGAAPLIAESGLSGGEVHVLRDATERMRYARALRALAYRDPLTGLANRSSLMDRLGLELAHARRQRAGLALLFVDLDGFKAINDAHGHRAGDAVLLVVAERLRAALREVDTVARLGGDEFTVILPNVSTLEGAQAVARKLLAALEQPIAWEAQSLQCSASIGIALHPEDGDRPEELLEASDARMYRAKASGGGRVALRA
jgi:diguanylate cyclase (GGDEF)-like protein/PAS domain S-box-containing protein